LDEEEDEDEDEVGGWLGAEEPLVPVPAGGVVAVVPVPEEGDGTGVDVGSVLAVGRGVVGAVSVRLAGAA
jgi:hypothetical protein